MVFHNSFIKFINNNQWLNILSTLLNDNNLIKIINILSIWSICDLLSHKLYQFYQLYQCVIYCLTNISILSNLSMCDILFNKYIKLINVWYICPTNKSILSNLSICDLLSDKYINFIKFINVWYIVQQINQFYQLYQFITSYHCLPTMMVYIRARVVNGGAPRIEKKTPFGEPWKTNRIDRQIMAIVVIF